MLLSFFYVQRINYGLTLLKCLNDSDVGSIDVFSSLYKGVLEGRGFATKTCATATGSLGCFAINERGCPVDFVIT